MKAIETSYNGYLFRSRTEARWAVFFDTLGIRYEYEKEGYELEDGTWYLPDFWLPTYEYWIEIKGVDPTPAETEKARQLCIFTQKRTFIFTECYQAIAKVDYYPLFGFDAIEQSYYSGPKQANWPDEYYQGWQTWMYRDGVLEIDSLVESDDYRAAMHPVLMTAYKAARSADFKR